MPAVSSCYRLVISSMVTPFAPLLAGALQLPKRGAHGGTLIRVLSVLQSRAPLAKIFRLVLALSGWSSVQVVWVNSAAC
jgi:hypothetical protein